MNRALLLLLAVGILSGVPCSAETPSFDTNRIVVMISIDGLAAYYIDDPKADMPTLRELAREGARASMMKASTPTVTWPNHTTLVTGVNPAQHGVVGNNYLDRKTGERVRLIADPVLDKDQIVKVPTIYDIAHAAGMKTAAIRWPATRRAKSLDWTAPDVGTSAETAALSTPALQEEMAAMGIPLDTKKTDKRAPSDDEYTRIFNMILAKHRPQLALLHLLWVDHYQHVGGPKSPQAYAAVATADRQVKSVWDELKKDFPGKATLLIVSDHGFASVKRQIFPNVILRNAGLIKSGNLKNQAVQVVVQGGAVFIYLLDDKKREEQAQRVREAFGKIEGVASVIGVAEYPAYGVADPKDDPHAPDLIAFAAEGYSFGDTAAGSLPFVEKPERSGSHGHDPNLPDLHATFVAWGDGIKPGVNLGEISNTTVAPTIARLLGLSMPNTIGQPLEAALAQ